MPSPATPPGNPEPPRLRLRPRTSPLPRATGVAFRTPAQHGVTIGFNWIGEAFRNFEGGINSRDSVIASTTDLNLSIDTDKALNWPGGKLYVDLEDHAGQNPSTALTGDLQTFDKLNAAPYLQVFELYYEQKLFHDILRIKIGKVDANSEYSVIDNGLDLSTPQPR